MGHVVAVGDVAGRPRSTSSGGGGGGGEGEQRRESSGGGVAVVPPRLSEGKREAVDMREARER